MKGRTLVWGSAVLLAALLGCEKRRDSVPESSPAPSESQAPVVEPPPSHEELRNATYHGFGVGPGDVTLVDGDWEGKPVAERAASRPRITLARDFELVGDVDADGSDEAVVLLAESGGGSGERLHLAVVDREAGQVRNVATQLLGDRVQVRDARVEDGRILFDVVQAGEGDAMCCPGELVTRGWHLRPGGLEEFVTTTTGRLSLETLGGGEWVLRRWARDEAAPTSPEVTLVYQDGKFAGKAGCNRYFAAPEPGAAPGDVSVGPAGATRMSCPPPEMEVEDRYLGLLPQVRKFGFMNGQLALTYEKDGTVGTMLFARRPLPPAAGH